MRRASDSFRNSGAYTSPGTPEYGGSSHAVDLPKTWSSERGPLPASRSALTPFNNGRPLPSKWDDAERWITSPISGYAAFKNSIPQPQRRPKSKSGPLGPTGLGYLSNYSPNTTLQEDGKVRNFMANSPLTTGVLVPEGVSVRFGEISASGKHNSFYPENSVMRRNSLPGFSDLLGEPSLPSPQGDKVGIFNEEASSLVLGDTSRRDMATQMSPEGGSSHSSSNRRLSFSGLHTSSSSAVRASEVERHGNNDSKDEVRVRDVQIDKSVDMSKEPKKLGLMRRGCKKKGSSRNVEGPSSFPWSVGEGSRQPSMLQREEAKITAWENLQKAKAEADIRKLEMQLEKKRSSSMEKIMNKLRDKQVKAQAMRDSLSVSGQQARETTRGTCRRICSLSYCFACH